LELARGAHWGYWLPLVELVHPEAAHYHDAFSDELYGVHGGEQSSVGAESQIAHYQQQEELRVERLQVQLRLHVDGAKFPEDDGQPDKGADAPHHSSFEEASTTCQQQKQPLHLRFAVPSARPRVGIAGCLRPCR
jgi:hypothetical protein